MADHLNLINNPSSPTFINKNKNKTKNDETLSQHLMMWKINLYWKKYSSTYCICCSHRIEEGSESFSFCKECKICVKPFRKSYIEYIKNAGANMGDPLKGVENMNIVSRYINQNDDIKKRVCKIMYNNMILIIRTDTEKKHKRDVMSLVMKILKTYLDITQNTSHKRIEC